jgi:hypothetical protein
MRDVTEKTRYDGAPALLAGGCIMAAQATHPSAEPGSLVIRVSPDDRQAFLDEAPQTYYLTAHYAPHPVVLVRLAAIDAVALADLLGMSRRFTLATTRRRVAARASR